MAWLNFESLVNARDVGGMRTAAGPVQSQRLIRSDNLQSLTPADITQIQTLGVTDVVDLRSHYEVVHEGPGPLRGEAGMTFHHHSYLPEQHDDDAPEQHDETIISDSGISDSGSSDSGSSDSGQEKPGDALPWIDKTNPIRLDDPFATHYLGYLMDRPASVLGALRAIAHAKGAVLVHCAAGKDRTGTTVALALSLVGADREEIIADYALSSERMQLIVDRLMATDTYRPGLEGRSLASHMTHPESMRAVLEYIDTEFGGVEPMLSSMGWTARDGEAMRAKLLG